MKTGFAQAFANFTLNWIHDYHGEQIECKKPPKPEPFVSYETTRYMVTHKFTFRSNWPDTQDADLQAQYRRPGDTYEVLRNATKANNSPMVHMGMNVGQIWWEYYNHIYAVCRSFVWFRTDDIPKGAFIKSASLSVIPINLPTDRYFVLVIQRGIEVDENGIPLVHHNPVMAEDYNRENVFGDGGNILTIFAVIGEFLEVPLNDTGISWINKGENAVTKFCLRSKDDILGNPPRGWWEYINFNSGNTFTTADKPKLEVLMYVINPTVDTLPPILIKEKSATFLGQIKNNGFWLGSYGFIWKKGITGKQNRVIVGGSSDQKVGLFLYNKYGLEKNTEYYYIAWAENEAGVGYGNWVSFKTL